MSDNPPVPFKYEPPVSKVPEASPEVATPAPINPPPIAPGSFPEPEVKKQMQQQQQKVIDPPFNLEAAKKRVAEVKAYYMQFEGKTGYNPHFYLQAKVMPLETILNSPEFDPTDAAVAALTNLSLAKLETNEFHAKASATYYGNRSVVQTAILPPEYNKIQPPMQHGTKAPPVTFNGLPPVN